MSANDDTGFKSTHIRVDAVFIVLLPVLALIFVAIMCFRHHRFKNLRKEDIKLVKLYCGSTFPVDPAKAKVCEHKQGLVLANERKLRMTLVA